MLVNKRLFTLASHKAWEREGTAQKKKSKRKVFKFFGTEGVAGHNSSGEGEGCSKVVIQLRRERGPRVESESEAPDRN